MKFLQIKPLCQATANYLIDWPPSGSSYSVEWPCLSLPPPPGLLPPTTPTTPLSPNPNTERGHFEKNPRGPHSFQKIIYFIPPFTSLPPPSPNHLSIQNQASVVCMCVCGLRVRWVGGIRVLVAAVISYPKGYFQAEIFHLPTKVTSGGTRLGWKETSKK